MGEMRTVVKVVGWTWISLRSLEIEVALVRMNMVFCGSGIGFVDWEVDV